MTPPKLLKSSISFSDIISYQSTIHCLQVLGKMSSLIMAKSSIHKLALPAITDKETKRIMELLESREEFISFLNLHHVEKDIESYLNNLKSLSLCENIQNISLLDGLSVLHCLEDLKLSRNKLTTAPKVILTLKSLKKLTLSYNAITELISLDLLEHLESLNVSNNKLSRLPASFASMNQLNSLNISSNKFKRLPDCLQQGLVNLEYLNVSGNMRLNPNPAVSSHKLKKFIATDLYFCSAFPRWLLSDKFLSFQEVHLCMTKFNKFFVSKTTQKTMIKQLNLENCSLTCYQLEKILSNIIGLRILRIGNKEFGQRYNNLIDHKTLNFLTNPEELLEFQMRNTALSSLPKLIKEFRDLRKIDIGGNKLFSLPEEFCELQMLEILIVDNNSLINLPENMGNLMNLREIRASSNILWSLPASFKELNNLELLDLYDNEFSQVPAELVGGCCEALIAFDFEMNFISSEAIKVMKTPYEVLRETIRNSHVNYRKTGRKVESPVPFSYNMQADSNVVLESVRDSTTSETNNPLQFENWDEPEDSSEEFDPYNPQPQRTTTKFIYLDHLRPRFCPNDIHPLPMSQRIIIARANGNYQSVPDPVQGQFSDA